MSEEIKGWQLAPRSMTPTMRELMLRADEFTVDEMWIMLLAAAPLPPVDVTPPAPEPISTGSMEPVAWEVIYYHGEPDVFHDKKKAILACGEFISPLYSAEQLTRIQLLHNDSILTCKDAQDQLATLQATLAAVEKAVFDGYAAVAKLDQVERKLATLQAKLEQAEKDEKRYAARRKSAFLARMRMQVGEQRRTEDEFNVEYDTGCDKNIAGYVVDSRGVWVKDKAMALTPKYKTKK